MAGPLCPAKSASRWAGRQRDLQLHGVFANLAMPEGFWMKCRQEMLKTGLRAYAKFLRLLSLTIA